MGKEIYSYSEILEKISIGIIKKGDKVKTLGTNLEYTYNGVNFEYYDKDDVEVYYLENDYTTFGLATLKLELIKKEK